MNAALGEMRRSFLVLQGPASPFFSTLSLALMARGHTVCRVNFCGGDVVYGSGVTRLDFRGGIEELPGWYETIMEARGITDILMFGDCRRIHQPVHAVARAQGANVHVFEEGYVRPNWITLEQHGVNGRSTLSRDPQWYREQRAQTPPSPQGYLTGYNLFERARHDVGFRLANALYAARFARYRSHRPHNGVLEYSGLGLRALHHRQHRRHAKGVTNGLLHPGSRRRYYILPLQLNSDAQIVFHSSFSGVKEVIAQVLASFARHAPADAWLVIKNHPLDTGLIGYRRYALQLARHFEIAERVYFIDAGHLPTLLENASGVIVVNSTVGLSALHHQCPLKALGTAIYDMDGLTWQGELDDFWIHAEPPDMTLYQAFLDYVVHQTQINGDFYTRTGIAMATAGVLHKLEAAPYPLDVVARSRETTMPDAVMDVVGPGAPALEALADV
jgi:capsular polysaccharide export protein